MIAWDIIPRRAQAILDGALLSREKPADGFHARVLGCGLVARLSIGTLQLSIRCSSIHFLLSRSFPVSAVGVFKGKVAAFGVGRSSCDLSWAGLLT
jgi:hypothetical protein